MTDAREDPAFSLAKTRGARQTDDGKDSRQARDRALLRTRLGYWIYGSTNTHHTATLTRIALPAVSLRVPLCVGSDNSFSPGIRFLRHLRERVHDEPAKREHQHQRGDDRQSHQEATCEEHHGEHGNAKLSWGCRRGTEYRGLMVSDIFDVRVTSTQLSLQLGTLVRWDDRHERTFSGPDRARVGIRTHRFRNCFLVASPNNCHVTRGRLRFRGGRSPAIAVCAR